MALHYSLSRRVVAGVGVVLLAGLTITATSAVAAQASDHRAATEGMRRRADLTAAAVRAEILRYQDTLTMLASSMSAQTSLEKGDFDTITAPMLTTRLRGASGLQFVVPGTIQETPSIQAYWRLRGAGGLTLRPTGISTQHVYPVFSRALDGRSAALGQDLSGSAQLAQTLRLAGITGRIAVSEPYVLAEDSQLPADQQQVALSLATEVTDPSGAPRGWVVMALRSADLLAETLAETGQDAINATLVTIRDGQELALVSHRSGRAGDPRLTRRVSIPIAQQDWTLITQGTDAAAERDAGGGILTRGVLIGGPIGTVLLGGLVFVLMTSRQRVLTAFDRAVAEAREADQRFRLAFEQAHTGMAIVDLRASGTGRFLRVNQALCAMLGYTSAELLSRTFTGITHPEDLARSDEIVAGLVAEDTAIAEKRYLHADGSVVWTKVNSTLIRSADGAPSYAVTQIENITERLAETARLSAMALQDPLTGVGNRLLFEDRMAQAVARAIRSHRLIGVIFCDLDRFKEVNDTYGHAVGDEVLRQVATRIRRTVRTADTVARLGGDEFVVLCEELETPDSCNPVIARILEVLALPVELPNGTVLSISCSLGSTTAGGGDGGIDVAKLLHQADLAMYRSKQEGRFAVRGVFP